MLKEAVPMLDKHYMNMIRRAIVKVLYNAGSLVHCMVRHLVYDVDLEVITLSASIMSMRYIRLIVTLYG